MKSVIAYKNSQALARRNADLTAPTAGSVGMTPTEQMLNTLLGGRTSTLLSGVFGEDSEQLRTSRVLLGRG
jgi:hypothetical protein